MALRVVTYDFTVDEGDVGELDRRIRSSTVIEICDDIEEVGVSDPDEPDDFEKGSALQS